MWPRVSELSAPSQSKQSPVDYAKGGGVCRAGPRRTTSTCTYLSRVSGTAGEVPLSDPTHLLPVTVPVETNSNTSILLISRWHDRRSQTR